MRFQQDVLVQIVWDSLIIDNRLDKERKLARTRTGRHMSSTNKFRVFCQLVFAIPFLLLLLAGIFLAGTNLVMLFVDKASVEPSHSVPLKVSK